MVRGEKVTRIVVEVSGGVAEVTSKPKGVEVLVIDWDNIKVAEAESTDRLDVVAWYTEQDLVSDLSDEARDLLDRWDEQAVSGLD